MMHVSRPGVWPRLMAAPGGVTLRSEKLGSFSIFCSDGATPEQSAKKRARSSL